MRTLFALSLALVLQQTPRYPAPAPEPGSGIIRGRVIASDTGAPVRRAIVTVAASGVWRRLLTDGEGRYEARNLLPGAYSVVASPNTSQAQFLESNPTTQTVPLSPGQTIEWHDLVLLRAGAIVGRIVDEYGDPVSGVSIAAQRAGDPPGRNTMPAQSSDELGRYRVFRLPPGEYEILARPSQAPLDPGNPGGVAFIDTYYPRAQSRADTVSITVHAGRDTTVDDLRLLSGRLMRVRGVIAPSSAARRDPAPIVSLRHESGGVSRGVDADGAFTFDRQRPGAYRLTVRALSANREATVEYGSIPLTLTDRDVDGIVVTLKPTVTLSGRVVFDGPSGPPLSGALSVRADRPQRDPSSDLTHTPARVAEDFSFTLRDLAGELLLRPAGGMAGPWSLKAVLLDGRDITDVPREFQAGDSGRIQIVLTERWAEVTGLVRDDSGSPVPGSTVVLFGEDRSTWFAESSRMRAASVRHDGRFAMQGLRAGRYHLAALPPKTRWDFQQMDRALLEQHALDAPPLAIGDGERRQIDLKVTVR